MVANWKVWVPFQFLNFRFVPVNLQVRAANVIALAVEHVHVLGDAPRRSSPSSPSPRAQKGKK